MKKLLSVLMAICMLCTIVLPVTALAAGNNSVTNAEVTADADMDEMLGFFEKGMKLINEIIDWFKSLFEKLKAFFGGADNKPQHTHSFYYEHNTGEHWQVCSECGETTAKENHTFTGEEIVKEATCTENGEKLLTCSACMASKTQEIEAAGHNYVATEVVAPQIGVNGYTVYECTVCGDSYHGDETDMLKPDVTIGDKFFESFDDALAAANDGDVITCHGSFSATTAITKDITIDGADFTNLLKIDGANVTLNNVTFTDTEPGEGAYTKNAGVPYRYELTNGAAVTESNVSTVLNVYTADELWEITNVSNRITKDGTIDTVNVPRYQFEGVTINILSDIDLEKAEWRPICQYPDHPGFKGTLDGHGHTIYNLNAYGMNDSGSIESNGNRHCQGFIGYAASGAVIKNLNFKDAKSFSANSIVGVVVANSLGGVTIESCNVDNAELESNYYIAAIAGKAGAGDVIKNCTVTNVTVKSWYKTNPENYSGAIYGTANAEAKIENCSYENVTVCYFADTDGDGVKEVINPVNATH